MERFDNIELTEEEIDEALRYAREMKHYRLKQIQYFQSLDKPRNAPKPTKEELFDSFRSEFQTDNTNHSVVLSLCCYFSEDKIFSGDLKKGILLAGGVGVGKTTIMNFFRQNYQQSYRVISARTIENAYSKNGEDALREYSVDRDISLNVDKYGHNSLALCIDDLGTEVEGKHYGKDRNVLGDIILNRYDAGLTTHITTNATADEIREVYGARVADRLRQMINIIQFPTDAKSRRQ